MLKGLPWAITTLKDSPWGYSGPIMGLYPASKPTYFSGPNSQPAQGLLEGSTGQGGLWQEPPLPHQALSSPTWLMVLLLLKKACVLDHPSLLEPWFYDVITPVNMLV